MNKLLETVAGFLKGHLISVQAQPEINVDFGASYNVSREHKLALRTQWEDLLKEFEAAPKVVVKRSWSEFTWSWERREHIEARIDGIILELRGPEYPMPGTKPAQQEVSMTEESHATKRIDEALPIVLNFLGHASPEKKQAVLSAVSYAIRGTVSDDELIRKVSDDVIRTLSLRGLLK